MTIEELYECRRLAEECNLVCREFLSTPCETVLRVCNGIGPEWFPEKLRKAIDALHPSLRVVAAIHDLWYYYGTGSDEDFRMANAAFADNGIAVARHLFGWWNPRRYLVELSARRFAKLCDIGGRYAYCAAIAERKRDEEAAIKGAAAVDDLVSGAKVSEAAEKNG